MSSLRSLQLARSWACGHPCTPTRSRPTAGSRPTTAGNWPPTWAGRLEPRSSPSSSPWRRCRPGIPDTPSGHDASMTMTALPTFALNPAQDEVVRSLMALGEERPAYDPDLAPRLRRLLDDGLAPAAAHVHAAGASVAVFKHALTNVLQCEGMAAAAQERGFSWS